MLKKSNLQENPFDNKILSNIAVNLTLFGDLRQNFEERYNYFGNPNPEDEVLEVKVIDLLSVIPAGYLTTDGRGIAFHHVIENEGGQDFYSFAVTAWKYENNEFTGVPLDNNKLRILNRSANQGTDEYDFSNLAVKKQTYHKSDTLKVKNGVGAEILVKTLPKHPQACYFEGKNFKKMLDDNTMGNNDVIEVLNGAIYKANAHGLNVHSPILVCNKAGVRQLSDEGPAGSFENKALDVGRLCPPECNKPN
ncbi:MAG: hypothetical protein JJ975_09635 [Bacteroidia bacterium]|nr:hypothetical protein [Bacteroidia bacterium]